MAADARRMRARAAAEEQRLDKVGEVGEAGEASAQAGAGLTPGQERYLNRAMNAYARQAECGRVGRRAPAIRNALQRPVNYAYPHRGL